MNHLHRYKKPLIILTSALIIFVVLVIFFISPITKYLIQKYDEKYTGREVTLKWAFVNPFTGYIHLSKLKIYDLKSDSIFFSAKGVSLNFAMLKLFSGTYEISEFRLNHPRGIIIQNEKDFNFNDLVEKFSSKEKPDTTRAPVHFNILNVKITDGEFHYREKLIPINYFIKNVNFTSEGKRWDSDTIAAQFSFNSGIGSGDMKGDFTINIKNNDYRIAAVVNKFDLNILEQYLNDLTNYGSFSAFLDADIKSKGTINDIEKVTTTGWLEISDFHFGKNPRDDYASFDKLVLAIHEISPGKQIVYYDSVSLTRPYLKYERYDYLDNLQTMFGKDASNIKAINADPAKFNLVIEIANYLKKLSAYFLKSHYRIDRLAIYNGNLEYDDYSLSEKFSLNLVPFSVFADSIDKNHERIEISLKSGIKPYGNLSGNLSINPKDSGYFDIEYNFQKLPASMFNPYTISFTSFPFDRGTIDFKGTWNVRNGSIKSDNHLIIIDPRLASRRRNEDLKWIPMPLIMAFIRERGNVIDYEIPVSGNLKDPKFHLKDMIIDLLGNIIVKPATIPYRTYVKNVETEIEKSLTLKWEMRNTSLQPEQQRFIKKMADFLVKNPDATISVHPQLYTNKEKEYILFYEAKKKYYLVSNNKNEGSFSGEDSDNVTKMSVKDTLFIRYIDKDIKDSLVFTIQEKCIKFLDSTVVNTKYDLVNKERENNFIDYFKGRGVEKQVKFERSESVIPYNGFSYYKIEYKGEFPESLFDAYLQMNELNDQAPRKIFKKRREKNDSPL